MGVTLKYEMKDEYLYVKVTGLFSLEDTLDGFMETLEKAAENNATQVLVDCLQLRGTPTTLDMFAFGKFVSEVLNQATSSGMTRPHMALVAGGSLLAQSHFGGLVAKNRGVTNVRAFHCIADALTWLNQGSKNATGKQLGDSSPVILASCS